jgi:hypothetical protein
MIDLRIGNDLIPKLTGGGGIITFYFHYSSPATAHMLFELEVSTTY